jgi:hypothetical protein
MGGRVILYILAFVMFVGVVFLIERRDSQAGARALKEVELLKANLTAVDDKLSKLDGILDRLSMAEQGMGTMADKTAEYFRVAEAKINAAEMIAHSAKLDAMRRPQKIEIDMPAIRVVQACAKKKKPVASPVVGHDKRVIQDVKKKLKELSN